MKFTFTIPFKPTERGVKRATNYANNTHFQFRLFGDTVEAEFSEDGFGAYAATSACFHLAALLADISPIYVDEE